MARRLPPDRARPVADSNRLPVPAGDAADTGAVADYIADMTAGLAPMAGDARLYTVTYFLNLARIEADANGRAARARGGPG